jgi:hypothetical protein
MNQPLPKSPDELRQLAETLEAAVYRKQFGGQILWFVPYPKQRDFFDAGRRLPIGRASRAA